MRSGGGEVIREMGDVRKEELRGGLAEYRQCPYSIRHALRLLGEPKKRAVIWV